MNVSDISEKNLEETIEQALLVAIPPVDLNLTRREIGQPAPLYGALTANLATGFQIRPVPVKPAFRPSGSQVDYISPPRPFGSHCLYRFLRHPGQQEQK